MLPRVPLVPQELRVHPFGGSVAVLAGLLDAILVGLVRLVVSCVVLRLRPPRKPTQNMYLLPPPTIKKGREGIKRKKKKRTIMTKCYIFFSPLLSSVYKPWIETEITIRSCIRYTTVERISNKRKKEKRLDSFAMAKIPKQSSSSTM